MKVFFVEGFALRYDCDYFDKEDNVRPLGIFEGTYKDIHRAFQEVVISIDGFCLPIGKEGD